MGNYSIELNMQNKKAIIVGGGEIAFRKLATLLQAGADITVISPSINKEITRLVKENKITWLEKYFEAIDLYHAHIVIAATNDKSVNRFVACSANAYQLVNVVDDPLSGNFNVPATLKRGDLTISIATGGTSPVLAKKIRDEISLHYGSEYSEYIQFLSTARKEIKKLPISLVEQNKMLREITEQEYQQSKERQRSYLDKVTNIAKRQLADH